MTFILQQLRELIQADSTELPSLVLNKHCSYCQFQNLCQTQAEKDDNLSLLSHATAKVLKHYEKKGIFTVKQLSYLYKPRRRNKRVKKAPLRLHKLELQALAIRTNKIYLHELPQLTRKPIELFLDIEGIPDRQYEYLIGLLVCDETNSCKHYSFWADAREDEGKMWPQFTEMIDRYPDAPIYHYGDYEVRAIAKLAKRYESELDLDTIKKRLVNINTCIYGQVYFPEGYCQKCYRNHNPIEIKVGYLEYGHGLRSWAVYNRLFLRLPYRVIAQASEDRFGLKISESSILTFMRCFGEYYTDTEQVLIKNILQSPFIHADETKVNIQGTEQYVWVFTDGNHVVFKLTPTRESEIVHEFLGDYAGTLISDFYPGYDSIKCKQQKCWVHLI